MTAISNRTSVRVIIHYNFKLEYLRLESSNLASSDSLKGTKSICFTHLREGKSISPKFATEIEPPRLQRRKKGRKKKKNRKNGLLEVGNNCRVSKQKRFEYVRTVLRNIPRGA